MAFQPELPDFLVTLIVKSEPMDIDLVDAEQAKSAETLKKPIKQEAVKKEVMEEKTLSNLLSTQSLVCMSDHENPKLMLILGYVSTSNICFLSVCRHSISQTNRVLKGINFVKAPNEDRQVVSKCSVSDGTQSLTCFLLAKHRRGRL